MLLRWLGVGAWAAGSWALLGRDAEPDYASDIRPILDRSCMPCHTESGVGPFSFARQESVVRHSALIRVQALSGSMPPTPYTSDFGPISLAPPLSDEDRVLLQRWIRQGKPGTASPGEREPSPPAAMEGGLQMPTLPKLRLEGAPYGLEYTIPVPEGITDITGWDWRAESPRSVRRVLLSWSDEPIAPRETAFEFGSEKVIGMLAPGYAAYRLPEGTSLKPEGRYLRIQQWMHPSGRAESAQIALAPVAARAGDAAQLLSLNHPGFEIKPESNPVLTLRHTLDRAARLHSVLPEARFYASRVTVRLIEPGKPSRVAFHTLRWSPLWTGHFAFPKPISLPKGTEIVAEIQYNNDERCPMNEGKKPELILSGPGINQEACRLHMVLLP